MYQTSTVVYAILRQVAFQLPFVVSGRSGEVLQERKFSAGRLLPSSTKLCDMAEASKTGGEDAIVAEKNLVTSRGDTLNSTATTVDESQPQQPKAETAGEAKPKTQVQSAIEAALRDVSGIVPTTDDPSMPVSTFRAWFIGLIFSVIGSGINNVSAVTPR